MGLFDVLKKKDASRSETFAFAALPASLAELKALPEASLDSPYKTGAVVIVALCLTMGHTDTGDCSQFLREYVCNKFRHPRLRIWTF